MKFLPLVLISVLLIASCDESGKDEIYNENNTNISKGVVYNIDEKPIDGLYRVYYPDGNVKMEVESKGGLPNGSGNFYNSEGLLHIKGFFINGKANGVFYNYYPTGKIHNEMSYADGVKDGAQRVYDEDGNLIVELFFEKGVPSRGYTVIKDEKREFSPEELEKLK